MIENSELQSNLEYNPCAPLCGNFKHMMLEFGNSGFFWLFVCKEVNGVTLLLLLEFFTEFSLCPVWLLCFPVLTHGQLLV